MTIKYAIGNTYDPAGSVFTCMNSVLSTLSTFVQTHPAWTLVEDVTPGTSSTVRWVVWKCSASVSGLPNDYYVGIQIANSTGAWTMVVMENYTAGSSRSGTGVTLYDTSATSRGINADGTNQSTLGFVSTTGAFNITGGPTVIFTTMTAALPSALYAFAIYDDHMVINPYMAANYFPFYLGSFSSLVASAATADPMPLVAVQLNPGISSNSGAFTRHPLLAGVAGTGYWLTGGIGNSSASYASISASIATVGDLFQGGAIQATELYAFHVSQNGSSATLPATRGLIRGKYKSLRLLPTAPGGMGMGDTVSMDGTAWAHMGVGLLVDTGVAA